MEPERKRVKVDVNGSSGLLEKDVGIRVHLSDHLGFTGIIKQRYTDFLVNEIDLDGNVLKLTDAGLAVKMQKNSKADGVKNDREKKEIVLGDDVRQELVELVGNDIVEATLTLFRTGTKIETTQVFDDREIRTKIHQTFRKAFGGRVETKTTDKNQLTILLATGNTRKSSRQSVDLDLSSVGPLQDYIHFVIYKENKETMEVANLIAKFLRLPPKSVSYVGTKDRRGVTVQQACIKKMKAERVNSLNKTLIAIRLGSFKYKNVPLRLGELKGNEFYITLREVQEKQPGDIQTALESFKKTGFVNYYGMQRFGTFSISTHTVGKFILNGRYEEAVQLLLANQELVVPDSVAARKVWEETRDAAKTLKLMPRKCAAEFSVLQSLATDSTGYLNAIMRIPKNLRVMYVHAYQSFIWNEVASQRISKYGMDLVEGDLVIDERTNTTDKSPNQTTEEDELFEDLKETQYVRARPVTSAEIQSGAKTIFDVVLPTPGFDILYPSHLEHIYRDIMAGDGLDHTAMQRNIREFSLSGSYRPMISKPEHVEWWVKKYNSPMDQLVWTDLDLLNQGKDPATCSRIVEPEIEGDQTAVVIRLQLGSSQYATMALREILKTETSRRGEAFFTK